MLVFISVSLPVKLDCIDQEPNMDRVFRKINIKHLLKIFL